MKIKKRIFSLALAGALALGLVPAFSMTALAADNVSTYTLQIPSMLNVSAAGWNVTSGLTAAVTENDIFDSGKKLSVTASSENSWALKSGDNTVGYNLAKATGTYNSSATPASWEFTAAELNASGGTNKAMGIIVDDYSEKPAGTYQDTVTFTTAVVDASADGIRATRAAYQGEGAPSMSWKVDDQVSVFPAAWSRTAYGMLNAEASNDGTTTLTGDLTTAPTAGDNLKLLFPRAKWDYTGQKGSLTDGNDAIQKKYDYAVADVTVATVDGNKITTTGDASFASQQAIVKFTLQDQGGNSLNASSLTISAASDKLVKTKGFIINPTRHTGGYNCDGGTDGFDPASYLVDGNKTGTKWCVNNGHKSGDIWYCEFHTASAVTVDGYQLTTGHDNKTHENRNPKDWVLKAKANSSDAWTTIATVTNDATLEDKNTTPYDFFVDVPGEYQYFRFEVSATRGADVMQLEELELFKCDYGTTYGDLTVTPASATSEIFVALRNEKGSADTYTVTANVGEKKYAFSTSDMTFQNGKYYEITVKMTEQTTSTVEWIFSEMSGYPDLDEGYTYKGVTLSGEGDLNFDYGNLYAMGDLTFTAPTGKKFKKIVINATNMVNISGSGWTSNFEPGNCTSTWTGDASSVTIGANSMADGVKSIVFTLE